MLYDKQENKNELILLGHMCSIRIKMTDQKNFFSYLSKNIPNCSLTGTKIGGYFFVSMYFETEAKAENAYNIMQNWN